jgi:hypothetical protein
MKKNWLLWVAVAVGAYLIYKRMSKPTDNGKEIAPPPVGTKPPVSPRPKPTGTTIEEVTIQEQL